MAIEWLPGQFFRFQLAIPSGVSAGVLDGLKKTTYSFRRMTDSEKSSIQPQRLKVITASAGDTQATMASRMAYNSYQEERFRVLNGLQAGQPLVAGQTYKIVVE
jgi:predicted Zn-dependent protease